MKISDSESDSLVLNRGRKHGEDLQVSSDLRLRTKQFALSILAIVERCEMECLETDVLKKQIIRPATSVGANYRPVCRSKSRVGFYFEIKDSVIEEADETQYWLEIVL